MIDSNPYKNEILSKHVFEQSQCRGEDSVDEITRCFSRPTKTKMKRYEKRSVREVG